MTETITTDAPALSPWDQLTYASRILLLSPGGITLASAVVYLRPLFPADDPDPAKRAVASLLEALALYEDSAHREERADSNERTGRMLAGLPASRAAMRAAFANVFPFTPSPEPPDAA